MHLPRWTAAALLATALVAGSPVASRAAVASPVISGGSTLSIVAGTPGISGAPTPGPATNSHLNGPHGLAVDTHGNLYIADTTNQVVEKVTPTGTLTIIAGTPGTSGAPTPGPATHSHLSYPYGVAVDTHGNLYIADTNNFVVEKIAPSGTLSIIAGTPDTYGTPSPGPATHSDLDYPIGVAVDTAGELYVADTNNHLVEKVTPAVTVAVAHLAHTTPAYRSASLRLSTPAVPNSYTRTLQRHTGHGWSRASNPLTLALPRKSDGGAKVRASVRWVFTSITGAAHVGPAVTVTGKSRKARIIIAKMKAVRVAGHHDYLATAKFAGFAPGKHTLRVRLTGTRFHAQYRVKINAHGRGKKARIILGAARTRFTLRMDKIKAHVRTPR